MQFPMAKTVELEAFDLDAGSVFIFDLDALDGGTGTPNPGLIATMRAIKEAGDIVLIFTDRDETQRLTVLNWLQLHHADRFNALVMCREGDSADIIDLKKLWLGTVATQAPDLDRMAVFEASSDAVKMYRKEGIQPLYVL